MSAIIIQLNQKAKPEKACSFCFKKESQVKRLIGGIDGACICDKCIAKSNELLGQANPVEAS